jgi:multidrug efflux system membrane fusion protein
VKPDLTAEERPVTVGITYQGETVVQSGLKAGETVVTDGQLRLTPDAKVDIKSALSSTNATTMGK